MDPMTAAFSWIEATAVSIWVREATWAFPIVLILHTVGLAFLVGANIALDARLLGAGRGIPLRSLDRFFPVMWLGFWVNALSGILLLAGYPTKALTNWLFYVKLGLIVAGILAAQKIRSRVRQEPALNEGTIPGNLKLLAATSLACWLSAITAGRLLAYTYSRLMATGF